MSEATTARTVPFGAHATLTTVADATGARALAERLRTTLADRVVEVVPGADTVLVTGHPDSPTDLLALVTQAIATGEEAAPRPGREHVLPVRYDGEDLAAVAALLDVSVQEVVARHTAPVYTVAFLGFAPGFPYLTGLDPFLTVPRLDTPRTRVPAGSVGLAAGQTCVYPGVSPGGWRLIGATDTVLFDPTCPDRPALLAPGDTLRFEAVR